MLTVCGCRVGVLLGAIGVVAMLSACDSPEGKAGDYLQDAQRLFENGDYARARVQLRNTLRIDDRQAQAWHLMARIAMRERAWQDALGHLLRVVDLDPENIDARVDLGRIYLGGGLYDQALQQTEELEARGFDSPAFHALRGAILLRLGDLEGAEREAKAALAAHPTHTEGLLLLAAHRAHTSRDDESVAILLDGIERTPKAGALHGMLVQTLTRQERHDDAIDAMARAMEAIPEAVELHRQLAALQVRAGRLDDAEATLRRHVATAPEDHQAKLRLITFLGQYRSLETAEAEAEAFIAEHGLAAWGLPLGTLYERAEAWEKARGIYEKLVAQMGGEPEGLTARTRLAVLALQARDVATARSEIDATLASAPKHGEALLLRAALAMEEREPARAIGDIRTVLRDDRESPRANLLLARAHVMNREWELAVDAYDRAIRAAPADATPYLELARLLLQRRAVDRAGRVVEQGLGHDPENKALLQLAFQVATARGDWLSAEAALSQLTSVEENEAVLHQMRGVVQRGQEKIDESLESFKKAHQAAPQALGPIVSVVRVYLERGQSEDAVRFLATLLKADSKNLPALLTLGSLYASQQQWEPAIEAFDAALQIDPRLPAAYVGMARARDAAGGTEVAIEALQAGLRALPGHNGLRLTLAAYYEKSGDVEAAISTHEAILSDNPKATLAANNLASLLSDHRDDEPSLQRAYNLARQFEDSSIPQFLDTLAWSLHRLGNSEAALPLLNRAVKQMPALPVLHYHRGMVQLALHRNEEARDSLRQAVDLGDEGSVFVARAIQELARLEAD